MHAVSPDDAERIFAQYPPLVLSRADGVAIRLTVHGYEFPAIAGGDDGNWLDVLIEVNWGAGLWRLTAPALMTWELRTLAKWLDALAIGQRSLPRMFGVEPLLSFACLQEGSVGDVLRVTLLMGEQHEPDDPSWEMDWDFPLAGIDLESIAASVRAMLLEFPERIGDGRTVDRAYTYSAQVISAALDSSEQP